jgi:phosphoribosylglycinamide formyltransferase 2
MDLRIFAKPVTRPYRRMGVALALAEDTDTARRVAAEAAGKVRIVYK